MLNKFEIPSEDMWMITHQETRKNMINLISRINQQDMTNLDSLHVHIAVQWGPLLCASFVGVGVLNFAILKRFWAFSSTNVHVTENVKVDVFLIFHEAHIIVHLRSPFHPLWLCQHLPPESKNTFEYFRNSSASVLTKSLLILNLSSSFCKHFIF